MNRGYDLPTDPTLRLSDSGRPVAPASGPSRAERRREARRLSWRRVVRAYKAEARRKAKHAGQVKAKWAKRIARSFRADVESWFGATYLSAVAGQARAEMRLMAGVDPLPMG